MRTLQYTSGDLVSNTVPERRDAKREGSSSFAVSSAQAPLLAAKEGDVALLVEQLSTIAVRKFTGEPPSEKIAKHCAQALENVIAARRAGVAARTSERGVETVVSLSALEVSTL